MPFNSYEFLVLFLPCTFIAFALVQHFKGWSNAFGVLAAASLIFYAQLSWKLLAILLVSVISNFVIGSVLTRSYGAEKASNKLLIGGILGNLFALGYFKYTNFFIDITNQITGSGFDHLSIILPIGISFYTFVQIGYLIEAHGGRTEQRSIVKYTAFATFFPYVTAGPLVMQKEIFDQMENRTDRALDGQRIALGLSIFAMGLFKKVVFADSLAPFANLAFDGVAAGGVVDPVTAWTGSLAYTLQLYFDFSGYSDMAIGLGTIFGLKLPLNFNSPFKATSISDFWQRWHMTMTRFFTNYVFSPMAMNGMRKAMQKKMPAFPKFVFAGGWPIIFTMLVAGIWHGSGWTFVFYGLLHGIAIAINNGWKQFNLPKLGVISNWLLTMSVVVSGLVIFRSPDMTTAGTMLATMWGASSLVPAGMGEPVRLVLIEAWAFILPLGIIVLCVPNTQEILSRHWIVSDAKPQVMSKLTNLIQWKPNAGWAFMVAALLVFAFSNIGSDSSFLYYDF
ncbi:MAG: MBOAT family protein [Rhizobiaceae bacterium]|nr:MBOAT family protein [Rhizobiaceae bacterium]